MRIRELEIEKFGIFSGKKFEFARSGLQLINGPNEAGKTTLLQLIREVLFGFAIKNPYAFGDNNGEMAATATIELSDGRVVNFRRRKGVKDVVVGRVEGDGRAVDEAALSAMLGRANARLYERVFGFSLAELSAGEKSLEDSGVTESLYGGSLGGLANFKEALAALQKEQQQLFKQQGSVPAINKLLASIKDVTATINKATVKPADYKQLCTNRDEAEKAVAELRVWHDELARRNRQIERLHKALPSWQRLAEVEKEAASIAAPQGVAGDAEKDYRRTLEAIDAAAAELAEQQEAIAEAESRLHGLKLEPQFRETGAAAAIESLIQKIGEFKGFRHDLPERMREAAEIRYALGETVARLNPAWDAAFLENFADSAQRSESVAAIAAEVGDLAKDETNLQAEIKNKTRKLAEETARLESLPTGGAQPELEELVENAGRYEADLSSLAECDPAIAEAAVKIEELRRGLDALPARDGGESLALDDIPVPLAVKIDQFAARFQAAREAMSQLAGKLEDARLELGERQFELQSFAAGQNVPDRERLERARRLRDAGWALIRKTFVERLDVAEDVGRWLAECGEQSGGGAGGVSGGEADDSLKAKLVAKYEEMSAAADALADLRQEKAELVARRERLAKDVRRLENKQRELESIRAEREADRETLAAEWRELWAGCRIVPDEPEVMRQWLRMHAEYRERLGRQKILEAKGRRLREAAGDFERRLREALNGGEAAPAALLREARRRVNAAKTATVERQEIEKNRQTLRREIDEHGADLEESLQQQETCRVRLREILGEIGLPAAWNASLADKALKELHEAKQKLQQAVSLDVRIRGMQEGIAAFETQVRQACEQLAPELADLAPETAAASLGQRLAAAEKAQTAHAELTKSLEKSHRLVKLKNEQIHTLREKIRQFRDAAGADSDLEFYRVAEAARRKAELLQEMRELNREIKTAAGSEDIEAFRARLAAADAESLEEELNTAADELAAAEKIFEEALKKEYAAQAELKRLDDRSEAALAAAELENRRAELRSAVDRWAELTLAESLMKNAVVRFELEHQPTLLAGVARLFSAMTLGRYQVVRRRYDEKNTLLVEDANGGVKEPSQLSSGTREQLYLAVRLAYVDHYCRSTEPLPLVMDDVLVNFDDARAAATLDALLEIAAEQQIIFLTCHRRTAEMIAARVPEMRAMELGGS